LTTGTSRRKHIQRAQRAHQCSGSQDYHNAFDVLTFTNGIQFEDEAMTSLIFVFGCVYILAPDIMSRISAAHSYEIRNLNTKS